MPEEFDFIFIIIIFLKFLSFFKWMTLFSLDSIYRVFTHESTLSAVITIYRDV